MGNSLRCCLACVLPCGALDLIRIVHINGSVDELTGRVTAGEVLKNNPNHVLTKPSSQGLTRRILILSPDSELKRGSIYFLIPASSLPAEKTRKILKNLSSPRKKSPEISLSESSAEKKHVSKKMSPDISLSESPEKKQFSKKMSPEIVVSESPEKKRSSRRHHRSRSNVGVWRPNLVSISED